jgi:hypothetical protein
MLADNLSDETKIPPHIIYGFTRQPPHFENAAILFIYIESFLSSKHAFVLEILPFP